MTVSLQQLRWAHTTKGRKALGKKGVREFEVSARGQKLPLYSPTGKTGKLIAAKKTTATKARKKARLAARKKG